MKSISIFFILLFSAYSCAQADKASDKVKKQTDSTALNILKERQKKKDLTAEQLKAEAKKRNIPYRKEVNGKIYQLQGFDKNGQPLYYTTSN